MKLIFLALPLTYICANGYLYMRTLQALHWMPLWGRVILSILFWVVAFSLFIAIGLRESQLPAWMMKSMFTAGSIWLGVLLYSVLALIAADLLKLAIPTMGHTLWYALPVTCALLIYGYINYRSPRIEQLEVNTERGFEGKDLKIVAISDIHLGYGTGLSDLQRYVEMINAQQPDLVLITGDLVDNSLNPLLREPFDKTLSSINAPMGIFMIPGNHEYISDLNKVSEYLKNTPIVLLRDSIATLPNGIQIIGRDDRTNHARKSLAELINNTDNSRPTILLDHQPYNIAEADSLNVDLLLCGHTHHGQLFPLNIITDLIYEQGHGYRKWSNSHVWVSSGLSLWGPPFRIATHSDLAVIKIKHQTVN